MTKERLHILIDRYLSETLTKEEQVELYTAINDPETEAQTKDLILAQFENKAFNYNPDLSTLYKRIELAAKEEAVPSVHRIHFIKRFRWVAAAVFIGIVAVAGWLILQDPKKEVLMQVAVTNVKAPAINRATIQLANGKVVYLDSAANGQLATLGDVQLVKLSDGRITYSGKSTQESYNTLTNPKGSQPIDIGLSDGTHVWLNAGSSITYPMAFVTNKERIVAMTGEAYFEVKHNAKAPFKVKTETQVIEDIGTSFNVNAYPGEAGVRTSLVEGSVKIRQATLKPGEQYLNGSITQANLEQALAWKNGFFGFDHADIHTVMREIGRWYDVEVSFEGNVKESAPFQGEIARGLSLAQLLKHLEKYPVRFRMEGSNRIVVSTPSP